MKNGNEVLVERGLRGKEIFGEKKLVVVVVSLLCIKNAPPFESA